MKRCNHCQSVRTNDQGDYCFTCKSHSTILDVSNTTKPTCPCCNTIVKDWEEVFENNRTVKIECDKCGQYYESHISNNPRFSNVIVKK